MSKSESVRSSTVKGVTVVKAEPGQWMQMWNERMTTLSIQRDIATAKLVDTDHSIHLVQIMFWLLRSWPCCQVLGYSHWICT